MDFGFSEDQQSLRSLAARVLDDFSEPGHLASIERGPDPFDRRLWDALARAGLIGAGLAPPHGAGMGLTGAAILLEEMGRRAVQLPVWATSTVALTLQRSGAAPHRLPALASGAIATPAFEERCHHQVLPPHTTATPVGGDWLLAGEKIAVPYGEEAAYFLVSVSVPAGEPSLVLVGRDERGLEVEAARGTAGEPQARLVLDRVRVPGAAMIPGAAGDAYQAAVAGLCATAAGLLEGGLRITASYIAGREQFGRPIASFQGAAMRIGDAYVDVQAVWASAWSAVWKLDAGRPAAEAVAIAKFWAAEGGHRAAHAFQHLHGGIGLDVDYPIHRYLSQAKAVEVALGGSTAQLERLGASIAAAGV